MNILALDLGGTSCKLAIIDENKNIVKRFKPIKTTLGMDLKWLFDELDKTINQNDYDYIGLSTAGFIDHEKSIVKLSGNLNYLNFDIKANAKKYTKKEIFVLNDANAATLGEAWLTKENIDSCIFYTIGTGIGGGLVINGKLVFGSEGFAGEFGHGGNFSNKFKCSCGEIGCIEPLASAQGLRRLLIMKAKENPQSELAKIIKKQQDNFDVNNVMDLLNQKDPLVINVFEVSMDALSAHISTMIYAINPQLVIIGGGISQCGQPLIDIIVKGVKKYSSEMMTKNIRFMKAKLGNDAGIFGAAKWVIDNKECNK